MKIAICLSGMPRNLENSYKWLKESILDILQNSGHDYDIFVDMWKKDDWNDSDPQKVVDIFKPKSFNFEIWNDEVAAKLGWEEFKHHKYEIESRQSALGQAYKVMKCNNLRKLYEKQYNVTYSIVMRMRCELRFNSKVDLNEIEIIKNCDKPIIFLRKGPNPQHIGDKAWTKDNWAIGNDKGINIYSDLFSNLLNISRVNRVCTSELMLRNWLYLNNQLIIEHTSTDYTLQREQT